MTDPVVIITLLGAPRGKGRHRSRIVRPHGKPPFIANYPDPETEAYEKALAAEGRIAMLGKPILDEPLSVALEVFVPVPASWSQKKQVEALAGRIMPTSKPDADNYAKMKDALNGIVWADDSLIVMEQTIKTYSATPAWRLTVWRWFEEKRAEAQQLNLVGDFD